MSQRPIRIAIVTLLIVISLAGCYTNPGPANLTPIPTLGLQPTLAPVAAVSPAAQAAGATPAAVAGVTPAGAPTAAPGAATPVTGVPGQAGGVSAPGSTPAATTVAGAAGGAAGPSPTATLAAAGGAPQGNPQEGQQLFAANCSPCHGADANGTPGLAPALRNNKFIQAGPDSAIFQTIANGRAGTAMPAWSQAKGGKLTDAQINSLIAYLKTLQQ